ncbi:MAG TPA: ABC transporter ATP-binding protein [Anaerolineaceae bacterium]|nr:ABC transporter ATP-binding protein [Anaerolineaceae bacterium]
MSDSSRQSAFIKLEHLTKIYQAVSLQFVALSEITITFHQNEFTAIVGRSGSGKSTLMNMMTGIDKPTSGNVTINGEDIHTLPETEMAKWRGTNLGIVFQFYQLIPVLSLLENVMLPMQIAGMYSHPERVDRAHHLLTQVNLQQFIHKRPYMVSGGQQQSTAIARALANDPPLLIADEPTGNLSSGEADRIFNIFQNLSRAGKTIIMVTHDEELANRAKRVLKIVDGKILNDNNPSHGPVLQSEKIQ